MRRDRGQFVVTVGNGFCTWGYLGGNIRTSGTGAWCLVLWAFEVGTALMGKVGSLAEQAGAPAEAAAHTHG